jgi:hypothetical protein
MCDLCSNDKATRKESEGLHFYVANKIESLAMDYRRLASHEVNPHSEQAKLIQSRAKEIVRILVNDWV